MSEFCLVLCTCPDQDSARTIARQAVEQRLAACVNIIPGLESVYRWQGEVMTDSEVQLVSKTYKTRLDALYTLVSELHPYDEPEWLVLDIADGSPTYLDWIKSSTT
ncbi:divalent-cation tolerance protein CutA [Bowmanella sp. Y26]|uniref:Divalent-cation tolerance protein CutA n=1 Tax=Bowmanella yangjiangensis TaxID=2811230 RepID=A0ABS3CWG6_9ALTE|nr:divalent-cation tolerance protein CutA [Bowmanella yangjiangensis]MBN7821466.1 divalent-cation tolerance protein CutA [Bowmanella yangjiangensis]MBT1064046.1 divalent-cation tolerance protein CutA [Bowmanella yangjiangensis]